MNLRNFRWTINSAHSRVTNLTICVTWYWYICKSRVKLISQVHIDIKLILRIFTVTTFKIYNIQYSVGKHALFNSWLCIWTFKCDETKIGAVTCDSELCNVNRALSRYSYGRTGSKDSTVKRDSSRRYFGSATIRLLFAWTYFGMYKF